MKNTLVLPFCNAKSFFNFSISQNDLLIQAFALAGRVLHSSWMKKVTKEIAAVQKLQNFKSRG
jgi:hypothetical protein